MRECEEWKSKSWSDGDGNSGLCGFEGAKPGVARRESREELRSGSLDEGSREAVRLPNRRLEEGGSERERMASQEAVRMPTDGIQKRGSKGREPCSFPVTIA